MRLTATFCVAITATILSLVACASPPAPRQGLAVETRSDAEITAFADYLAQQAEAVPAQPLPRHPLGAPNPFKQLDRLGLDGTALRLAALDRGVSIEAASQIDLARVELDAIDVQARRCLGEAIYYEARDQSLAGQMAVADVILNRVESARYPSTVCGVVYQGSHLSTGCQFSFTCDGSMRRRVDVSARKDATIVATAILAGFRLEMSKGATNYHARYVRPYWARQLERTATIDDHIFYRRPQAVRVASAD